jgi:hypothetical protein
MAVTAEAEGATRYVTQTGSDSATCGIDQTTACRSISQAIANAAPGDIVSVGPGMYGDLYRNGIIGEPGEETGSPGCGCVLSLNKNVIVISTHGAAVTMIDSRTVDRGTNVLLITIGGEFGRPGKGFTVTETARKDSLGYSSGSGIVIDSINVLVRGNQVIFTLPDWRPSRNASRGVGIYNVNDAPTRIEGNQVMNWQQGIEGRAATVSKNQVMHNDYGIASTGGKVLGNVVAFNETGILVTGPTTVKNNAAYSNNTGIFVIDPFSGLVTTNNIFNNACGVTNQAVVGLNATNNYWGAATGPGAPPASSTCTAVDGTTSTTPFAVKPFTVQVLKP